MDVSGNAIALGPVYSMRLMDSWVDNPELWACKSENNGPMVMFVCRNVLFSWEYVYRMHLYSMNRVPEGVIWTLTRSLWYSGLFIIINF